MDRPVACASKTHKKIFWWSCAWTFAGFYPPLQSAILIFSPCDVHWSLCGQTSVHRLSEFLSTSISFQTVSSPCRVKIQMVAKSWYFCSRKQQVSLSLFFGHHDYQFKLQFVEVCFSTKCIFLTFVHQGAKISSPFVPKNLARYIVVTSI